MSDTNPIGKKKSVVETIYMCDCGEVLVSAESEAECSRCERTMQSTGWQERIESGGSIQ